MPVGWFLVPYKRRPDVFRVVRYVAIDDLTPAIIADGGVWSEVEVLGQHAIVKVRAASGTLQDVANLAGVQRIPVARLDDSLSSLTNQQKTAIRNKVTSLGYSIAELQDRFPNDLGSYTLRELLLFIASRRRKVRYDVQADAIIDDGDVQPVRPLDDADSDVADD
jgi:hypothetical protein